MKVSELSVWKLTIKLSCVRKKLIPQKTRKSTGSLVNDLQGQKTDRILKVSKNEGGDKFQRTRARCSRSPPASDRPEIDATQSSESKGTSRRYLVYVPAIHDTT